MDKHYEVVVNKSGYLSCEIEDVFFSPNGIRYNPPSFREVVLPKVIFDTMTDILVHTEKYHPVEWEVGLRGYANSLEHFTLFNHFNTQTNIKWNVVSLNNSSTTENVLYTTLIEFLDAEQFLLFDFEEYRKHGGGAKCVSLRRSLLCIVASILRLEHLLIELV